MFANNEDADSGAENVDDPMDDSDGEEREGSIISGKTREMAKDRTTDAVYQNRR